MKLFWSLAATGYAAIVIVALGPLTDGGARLGNAVTALIVPPVAWFMARYQEDEHWQAVTVGTGVVVSALLLARAFSA